jgi:hypothetical protein
MATEILVYSTAYSVECPIYVVKNGIYKTKSIAEKVAKEKGAEVFKRVNIGSEKELIKNLDTKLAQIYDDLGTSNAQIYITASKVEGNFRNDVATILAYKGNRTEQPKPVHYRRIREILVNEYGAIKVQGQEADDQLAIEQMKAFKEHGNYDRTIIASIDKDLRTIPGQHYNFTNRVMDYVSEEEALKNMLRQLLIGDRTDNIPGLVKLLQLTGREQEAKRLINFKYIRTYEADTVDFSIKDCYNYILGLYMSYGFGEREISEIFNLIWLRRYEGQDGWRDFKEGKIIT